MALSFADDLKAKCDKMLVEVDRQCQHIAFELFTNIVILTPELTGALENNWFPGTGVDFSTETTSVFSKDGGSQSKARIYSALGKGTFLTKDGSMTLANNLPYAYRAEVEGWPEGEGANGYRWSGQVGPYAMVDRAMKSTAARYR